MLQSRPNRKGRKWGMVSVRPSIQDFPVLHHGGFSHMYKSETYFLRPGIILNDLEDAENNPAKYFIHIDNKEEVNN